MMGLREHKQTDSASGHQGFVLELLGGQEDATTGELVYQVRLLADYTELEVDLVSEPVTEVTQARSYGATSLFIDDACVVFNFPVLLTIPC